MFVKGKKNSNDELFLNICAQRYLSITNIHFRLLDKNYHIWIHQKSKRCYVLCDLPQEQTGRSAFCKIDACSGGLNVPPHGSNSVETEIAAEEMENCKCSPVRSLHQ
jgi:hypothetical protein